MEGNGNYLKLDSVFFLFLFYERCDQGHDSITKNVDKRYFSSQNIKLYSF